MTDDVRNLIRFVVDGDIRNAQTQCRIMLEKNVPEKDARFKEAELKKLNLLKAELIQLPANLESLLIAEDATNFPESRFLLREEEETVINKLLATRKAALAIKELGIHYTCSLLLTGLPGVGKTELARYIAHKANLPFVFLKFSGLVNSALDDMKELCKKFLASADYPFTESELDELCHSLREQRTASAVVNACTERIVAHIVSQLPENSADAV